MENSNALRLGTIWLALCAVLLFGSPCVGQPAPEPWDRQTDRPGMDYRAIDFKGWAFGDCELECRADSRCKAWTSVYNRQAQTSRCYLKSGVPTGVPNVDCISGTKDSGTVDLRAKPPIDSLLLLREASTCNKLAGFVTASPLPETGVGWDYKVQLQATGGVAPVTFLTPYLDPITGQQRALSCHSGGPTSGPAYYSGKMMVDGLTLTCDGRIIGQPKAPGYFTISITAKDKCAFPQQIEKKFVFEVKGPSQ